MRFPRLRAARLAAELAEVRDTADRAVTMTGEILARMDEAAASAGLPRPRTRPALYLVSTGEGAPPPHACVPARPPQAAGRHAFHPGSAA